MEKGNTVIVKASDILFGFWKPVGLRGVVDLVDPDGGVCVALAVTEFFRPHFWFPPSSVEPDARPLAQMPPNLKELESTFVTGRKSGMNLCPIRENMLRSWLIIKLRALPGQSVYQLVLNMSEGELMPIFNDNSDKYYEQWAKANDTRPKRTLIDSGGPELVKITESPNVRRPRLV